MKPQPLSRPDYSGPSFLPPSALNRIGGPRRKPWVVRHEATIRATERVLSAVAAVGLGYIVWLAIKIAGILM